MVVCTRPVAVLFRAVLVLGLGLLLGACSALHSSTVPTPFDPTRYDAIHRLRASLPVEPLPGLMVPSTPEVVREISAIRRKPESLRRSLARCAPYRDLIAQIFQDEGVPQQLFTLAIVESGCNPMAKSRAGALGFWQFMPTTARHYDLVVTRQRDDRTDVILSTIAAARHLRDLYREFQDWPLALAAYNAGVGGVRRAMIRAGADDFWAVAKKRQLRKQTIEYVPRILALSLAAADPLVFGIQG